MTMDHLERLRARAKVARIRRATAAYCRVHRLTVGDIRNATRRVVDELARVGLPAASIEVDSDPDFYRAVAIELLAIVERRRQSEAKEGQ